MKLTNLVTKLQDVLSPKKQGKNKDNRENPPGKRLLVPANDIDRIYQLNRKKAVKVIYTGLIKSVCKGCKTPFIFSADGRGRPPNYHSNACKQEAYRMRIQEGNERSPRRPIQDEQNTTEPQIESTRVY
jgi:hypothetical protein